MTHAGEWTDLERRAIAELQGDVLLRPDFFGATAARLGVSLEDLIACLKGLKDRSVLKRIGAVVRHQRMGRAENFLIALRVASDDIEEAGKRLAAKPFVSHCYEREVPPEFPFNLFAMVHATSREEADSFASEIRKETRAEEAEVLRSVREVKKESLRFF